MWLNNSILDIFFTIFIGVIIYLRSSSLFTVVILDTGKL